MDKWTHRIVNKKELIYYIQHHPKGGDPAYYFLLVEPKKEKLLQHAIMKQQIFDLQDYGDLVDSGYGEEAPKQVIDWITNYYKNS